MATNATQDTRKRQKTNVKGSMVSNPIFMIGKEVPHKAPAKRVKNMALVLLLSTLWVPHLSLLLVIAKRFNKTFFVPQEQN